MACSVLLSSQVFRSLIMLHSLMQLTHRLVAFFTSRQRKAPRARNSECWFVTVFHHCYAENLLIYFAFRCPVVEDPGSVFLDYRWVTNSKIHWLEMLWTLSFNTIVKQSVFKAVFSLVLSQKVRIGDIWDNIPESETMLAELHSVSLTIIALHPENTGQNLDLICRHNRPKIGSSISHLLNSVISMLITSLQSSEKHFSAC